MTGFVASAAQAWERKKSRSESSHADRNSSIGRPIFSPPGVEPDSDLDSYSRFDRVFKRRSSRDSFDPARGPPSATSPSTEDSTSADGEPTSKRVSARRMSTTHPKLSGRLSEAATSVALKKRASATFTTTSSSTSEPAERPESADSTVPISVDSLARASSRELEQPPPTQTAHSSASEAEPSTPSHGTDSSCRPASQRETDESPTQVHALATRDTEQGGNPENEGGIGPSTANDRSHSESKRASNVDSSTTAGAPDDIKSDTSPKKPSHACDLIASFDNSQVPEISGADHGTTPPQATTPGKAGSEATQNSSSSATEAPSGFAEEPISSSGDQLASVADASDDLARALSADVEEDIDPTQAQSPSSANHAAVPRTEHTTATASAKQVRRTSRSMDEERATVKAHVPITTSLAHAIDPDPLLFDGTRVSQIAEVPPPSYDFLELEPIIAVIGAETLIGAHVVIELLRRGCRHVKAIVASAPSNGVFLRRMPETKSALEIVDVGDLALRTSHVPLRGALRGVSLLINAVDMCGSHATSLPASGLLSTGAGSQGIAAASSTEDTRRNSGGAGSSSGGCESVTPSANAHADRAENTLGAGNAPAVYALSKSPPLSKKADRAVCIARAVADAASAPGSSVLRLIHIGSDMSVFDPKSSSAGADGEVELDENCWYDVSDEARKTSEADAYGATAAEMLLWAQSAGDKVPYTMCSVVCSLLVGPVVTACHAVSSPGPRMLVDYVARMKAIPHIPTPIVDCRDVAEAVASLVTTHRSVCGRVLMMGAPLTSGELVAECSSLYPGFPWPTRAVPRWAAGPGPGVPWRMSRKAVRARYGRRYALSQRRALGEVGITFRDTRTTVRDAIDSLSESGVIDLHARKPGRGMRYAGRLSSRLPSLDHNFGVRKTASGRV